MSVANRNQLCSLPELALLSVFDHMPLTELWSTVPLVCRHWHQLQPEALGRRTHLELLPPITEQRQWMRPLNQPGPVMHFIDTAEFGNRLFNYYSGPYHYLDTIHIYPRKGSPTLLSTAFIATLTSSFSQTKLTSLSVLQDWASESEKGWKDMTVITANVTTLIQHYRRSLTTLRVVLEFTDILYREEMRRATSQLVGAINQCTQLRTLQLDLRGLALFPTLTTTEQLALTTTLTRLRLLVFGNWRPKRGNNLLPLTTFVGHRQAAAIADLQLGMVWQAMVSTKDLARSLQLEWAPRIQGLNLSWTRGLSAPIGQLLRPFRCLVLLHLAISNLTFATLWRTIGPLDPWLPSLTHLSIECYYPTYIPTLNDDEDSRYDEDNSDLVVSSSVRWFSLRMTNLISHELFGQLRLGRVCFPALERISLSDGLLNNTVKGIDRQCVLCQPLNIHSSVCLGHLKEHLFALARSGPATLREVHFNHQHYARVEGQILLLPLE